MRNRMYGGVRGRKTKVGGNYFVFLLLDFFGSLWVLPRNGTKVKGGEQKLLFHPIPFSGNNQPIIFTFEIDSVFLTLTIQFTKVKNQKNEVYRVKIKILDFIAVICKNM